MNAKDFDKIVADRMAWCRQTLCAKGDEYAREGDRLWNFKVAGRKLNCHPAEALAGMMVKHTVSVDDIIDGLSRGIVPTKELVAEKIGDSIDYLLLLEGLIEEERRKREEVPEMNADLSEPWQAAISEQEAQVRVQVATSAQAKDTARDAMATSLRYTAPKLQFRGDDPDSGIIAIDGKINPSGGVYTIPPIQDGDDDPAVHIVPDKSSRSTLPPGCLGRLCGRGDYDEWRPCPEDGHIAHVQV